jgi:hypothetical protein
LASKLGNLVAPKHSWWSADGLSPFRSVLLAVSQVGCHTFQDYSALELCHGGHDRVNRFPHWRAGVEAFLLRNEIDSERAELFERENQLLYASSETVEWPGYYGIKNAAAGVCHPSVRRVLA